MPGASSGGAAGGFLLRHHERNTTRKEGPPVDLLNDFDTNVQAEDVTSEIDALHERAEDLALQARHDLENATRLRREANGLVRRAATLRAEIEEG